MSEGCPQACVLLVVLTTSVAWLGVCVRVLWCGEKGPRIPTDIEATLAFTRKCKTKKLVNVIIGNRQVTYTQEMKNLGVVLDKNFYWRKHLHCKGAIGAK